MIVSRGGDIYCSKTVLDTQLGNTRAELEQTLERNPPDGNQKALRHFEFLFWHIAKQKYREATVFQSKKVSILSFGFSKAELDQTLKSQTKNTLKAL